MESLLSVRDAQDRILALVGEPHPVSVPLLQAYRKVLAADVYAGHDLPPFTNSSMDGFAVRSDDTLAASSHNPVPLRVIEDIPAGSRPTSFIQKGEAARIMTGAALPQGADAVVPVEFTDFYQRETQEFPEVVEIYQPVGKGAYLRPKGEDIRKGAVVFQAGRQLSPQDVALLAALGHDRVQAYSPSVALFSSGDELLEPGEPITPGRIFDSNRYMLTGMLRELGIDVIQLPIAADDRNAIEVTLTQAVMRKPDLILSTAGVSVGAYDFVKDVIQSNGELAFWRVNMRPGKPVAVGNFKDIPFVGLPGNPVSAFVGCLVFVLPALQKLMGITPNTRKIVTARLLDEVSSDGRESYLRARVSRGKDGFQVTLQGHQGSANLFALTQANALLILPSGVKSLPAGATADVWLLDNFTL